MSHVETITAYCTASAKTCTLHQLCTLLNHHLAHYSTLTLNLGWATLPGPGWAALQRCAHCSQWLPSCLNADHWYSRAHHAPQCPLQPTTLQPAHPGTARASNKLVHASTTTTIAKYTAGLRTKHKPTCVTVFKSYSNEGTRQHMRTSPHKTAPAPARQQLPLPSLTQPGLLRCPCQPGMYRTACYKTTCGGDALSSATGITWP
ncbi:hypothetical protein V8C86DRAFT_2598650 [Haematococcus lacustris]